MKILLLGKDGQLGWELQRSLSPLGQLISLGHEGADFVNLDDLCDVVQQSRPNIIVNAAAYTAVDKAETESRKAFMVNADAVKALAGEAKKINSLFVHYSTDYVFDGHKAEAYLENDETRPLNAYGRSKLEGEKAILQSGCRHLVFRSSWIYSLRGENFPLAILRRAQILEQFEVVADCFGAPTSAGLVADVTALILYRILIDAAKLKGISGIYHLTASGSTSWYDFAQFIINLASKRGLQVKTPQNRVFPVSIEKFKNAACRPKNSNLSTQKLCNNFGLSLPDWRDHVIRFVEEIIKSKNLLYLS
jgi:dTDP-4-dehydrorhamnose reductase